MAHGVPLRQASHREKPGTELRAAHLTDRGLCQQSPALHGLCSADVEVTLSHFFAGFSPRMGHTKKPPKSTASSSSSPSQLFIGSISHFQAHQNVVFRCIPRFPYLGMISRGRISSFRHVFLHMLPHQPNGKRHKATS